MQTFSRAHIKQHFDHAAIQYEDAAVLQKRVAKDVDNRLDLITLNPEVVLDVGAGKGFLTRHLERRYPQATCIGLDLSEQMLSLAKNRSLRSSPTWIQRLLGQSSARTSFINGDANQLPLADQSVDLIVTNLMLQWCDDLDLVFSEFRRVLKPEGLLMMTTFGPDTLKELRQAWAKVDTNDHVNTFIDMHDIGDALIRNGFGQPVLDVEHFTLTYDKPMGVLKDLKAIGATRVGTTQPNQPAKGLTGKQCFTQMLDAYDGLRSAGRIPATYEVVHGHAWASPEIIKGPHRNRQGVVEIRLDDIPIQQSR